MQANQLHQLLDAQGVRADVLPTTWKFSGAWRIIEFFPALRTLLHLARFASALYRQAAAKTILHIFANSFGSFFLWTMTSVAIGKWRGARIIINYRGGHAQEFLRRWKMIAVPILRRADKIVVPSQFLEFVFLKYGLSTQVIPNILAEHLQPRRKQRGNQFHLIVNRNFEPIYNVACALRAFAIIQAVHPQTQLTLIGDGPQRAQLEHLAATLGLRQVYFAGQLANQEVIELLRSADLLLNPTNVDNMPISLLEAMAVGIPIVSTDVGGIPYLITNKVNGILVKKNDHQAMARAAVCILRSESLQHKLKHNAAQQARKCGWQNVWPQWQALYLALFKII